MDYETFKWSLLEAVRNRTERSTLVRLQHVPGINGTDYDGITLCEEQEHVSPVIALTPYYESFKAGVALSFLADDILSRHMNAVRENVIPYDPMPDYEKAADNIFYKAVNKKMNTSLLEEIPHRDFLDVSLVFYIRFKSDDDSEYSVLVTDDDLVRWNKDETDLFMVASDNIRKFKGIKLSSLEETLAWMTVELKNMGGLPGDFTPDIPLPEVGEELHNYYDDVMAGKSVLNKSSFYLLTTNDQIYGASALFTPSFLPQMAALLESDLYILPSSIHEVLILAADNLITINELRCMVRQVNDKEVPRQDILSYNVYYYDKDRETLSCAFPG